MTDKLLRFYDALGDEQLLMEYFEHDDWQLLLEHAERRTFQADETLLEAGEAARVMFIVVEGSLNVVVEDSGGDRRIDTIEAPSVFGEQTFLDGRPRSASIAARTDGACYCLHIEGLRALVRANPGLAAVFLYDLARVVSLRFRDWQ